MIPEAFKTSDLLAELIRRDVVRILQTTQRIEGVKFAYNLGSADDLRTHSIAMCQAMAGRALAHDMGVQLVSHRKFKTSASEEIMVTFMVVSTEAMKEVTTLPTEQVYGVTPDGDTVNEAGEGGFEFEEVPL